jgi:hypothetical protein
MKKWEWKRGEGDGAPSSYLSGLLHNFNFIRRYILAEPLTRGHSGLTLFQSIKRPLFLHRFASPRRNFCDSATYCRAPPRNIHPGFDAKPAKPSPGGFEAQPTKPPWVAYSIRVLPPSSTNWSPSLSEPLDSLNRRLDSVNTITPPYTLALVDILRCQPPRLVNRHLGLSVQASRLSFIALSSSAQHVPTWPSPHRHQTQDVNQVDDHSS